MGGKCLPGLPNSRVDVTEAMRKMFADALVERFSTGWNTLANNIRQSGLTSIATRAFSSGRVVETREKLTRVFMKAIFSWAEKMIQQKMLDPWTREQLKDTMETIDEEIRSGCYVRYDIYMVVGMKP